MRKIFIFVLLFLFALPLLLAKGFWEKKPYTKWSKQEALQMIKDSPWAKTYAEGTLMSQQQVTAERNAGIPLNRGSQQPGVQNPPPAPEIAAGGVQRGDIYRRERTTPWAAYTVSWYSALPVRQALVRLNQINGGVSEEQANSIVNSPQPNYVIAISGEDLKLFQELSTEQIKRAAYLKTSTGPDKVYPIDYSAPVPEGGQPALIVFPKEINAVPVITDKDKEVSFVFEHKRDLIKVKFRPKEMIYDGKLNL